MVLSVLGASAGVMLANGALRLIAAAGAVGIPQALDARIDAPVLLFPIAMSVVTGLAFALAPLRHVVTRNLHTAIRSATAATTRFAGARRFRHALIVSQLALALILLTEGFGWTTPVPGFDPARGGGIRLGAGGFPVIDYYQVVDTSYFHTLRIGLIAGDCSMRATTRPPKRRRSSTRARRARSGEMKIRSAGKSSPRSIPRRTRSWASWRT